MEGLAPPFQCILEIEFAIDNGNSIREGLNQYLRQASPEENFSKDLKSFLFAWDRNQNWREGVGTIKSPYRRGLLEIIAKGLSGHSIGASLAGLRKEVELACELELQGYIEMLPLKTLVPLLFFQFPAFLLLLLGPIVTSLLKELS